MKLQGCLLALLAVLSLSVKAERVFEFGAGAFAFSVAEYAGAKENKNFVVPLPYFYYQDKYIKVDRDGLIGSLWKTDRLYLDFSASAQIPVNSENIAIRVDMPDIDWTFQLGPALKYYFHGTPKKDNKTLIELYTRKAVVTDFSYLDDAGWQYGVALINQKGLAEAFNGKLKWQTRLTVNFASKKFHQLYYDVKPDFQTVFRPQYQSQAGYLSSTASTGLTYRKEQWWFAGFLLYRNLNGAKNEQSALLQKSENFAAGLGVAWVFK